MGREEKAKKKKKKKLLKAHNTHSTFVESYRYVLDVLITIFNTKTT